MVNGLVKYLERAGDFIQESLHNSEIRFRTVESESNTEFNYNSTSLVIKSTLRGAFVGGMVGGAVSGDLDGILFGAFSGAVLDTLQSNIRFISLFEMNKKDRIGYLKHKELYRDIGFIK